MLPQWVERWDLCKGQPCGDRIRQHCLPHLKFLFLFYAVASAECGGGGVVLLCAKTGSGCNIYLPMIAAFDVMQGTYRLSVRCKVGDKEAAVGVYIRYLSCAAAVLLPQ